MNRRALLTGTLVSVGWTADTAARETDAAPGMTSLVRLLAVPDRFDGRVVATAGFLALSSDKAQLYLHEEDFKACLLPNALAVEFTPEQRKRWSLLNVTHVAIRARFSAAGAGILGGTLTQVDVLDPVPQHTA